MSAPFEAMSLSTKARRRMRTSKEETAILESFYSKNPNPNSEQKQEIAEAVKMGAKNVHFWFQNRRAKDNKKRKLIRMRQEEAAQRQQQQQQQFYGKPQQIDLAYQQQITGSGNKFNLPPISTIMMPDLHTFSIPYYFHHSKFGIEDCMLQMQALKINDGSSRGAQ